MINRMLNSGQTLVGGVDLLKLLEDSDDEVRDFLVSRYGEFVLLEPRLSERTFFLWALPALGLVIGGMALLLAIRRGGRIAANPLSAEEKQRLQRLLEGSDVKKM